MYIYTNNTVFILYRKEITEQLFGVDHGRHYGKEDKHLCGSFYRNHSIWHLRARYSTARTSHRVKVYKSRVNMGLFKDKLNIILIIQ